MGFELNEAVVYSATAAADEDRDSSVGIATLYWLDGPGIESRWGARFSAPVQTGPGAHPASYTMWTGSFPGVKRPGRGADPPPQLAPRLRKDSRYNSAPPLGLRGLF
jgi:hypothetical protein